MFWMILRRMAFWLEPETAHSTIRLILRAIFKVQPKILSVVAGGSPKRLDARTPIAVAGLQFHSRVGLAAGFDKNAEWLEMLPYLGFGFAEIGTVTPRPQGGNPRPRLMRLTEQKDLFNRMGFNNLGATLVSRHLEHARKSLPAGFRVGINLGKNKDTPNEKAADDYEKALIPFEGMVDYVVINVSSPNTPGLRDLQSEDALKAIVDRVAGRIEKFNASKRPPVFLKLAPELSRDELSPLIETLDQTAIAGYVLTNTLQSSHQDLKGGISGASLTERSREALINVKMLTKRPIISVGGIMTKEEAAARIQHGAALVQVYSGWVYQGPRFPVEIDRHLQLTLT